MPPRQQGSATQDQERPSLEERLKRISPYKAESSAPSLKERLRRIEPYEPEATEPPEAPAPKSRSAPTAPTVTGFPEREERPDRPGLFSRLADIFTRPDRPEAEPEPEPAEPRERPEPELPAVRARPPERRDEPTRRIGVDSLIGSIAQQESGGDSTARNERTGAHGTYQIMPSNWGPWSREVFGRVVEKTPENQDAVAKHKLSQYLEKYGPAGAAVAWYAGPAKARLWLENPDDPWFDQRHGGGSEPSVREYVDSVLSRVQPPDESFGAEDQEPKTLTGRERREKASEVRRKTEVSPWDRDPGTGTLPPASPEAFGRYGGTVSKVIAAGATPGKLGEDMMREAIDNAPREILTQPGGPETLALLGTFGRLVRFPLEVAAFGPLAGRLSGLTEAGQSALLSRLVTRFPQIGETLSAAPRATAAALSATPGAVGATAFGAQMAGLEAAGDVAAGEGVEETLKERGAEFAKTAPGYALFGGALAPLMSAVAGQTWSTALRKPMAEEARGPVAMAFRILGLSDDASVRDINRAWRAKAKEVHPDVGGTAEQSAAINNARDVALAHAQAKAATTEPPRSPEAKATEPKPKRARRRKPTSQKECAHLTPGA